MAWTCFWAALLGVLALPVIVTSAVGTIVLIRSVREEWKERE